MMPAIFISASGQTPPKTPQDVLQGIPPEPARADAPARLRCAAVSLPARSQTPPKTPNRRNQP